MMESEIKASSESTWMAFWFAFFLHGWILSLESCLGCRWLLVFSFLTAECSSLPFFTTERLQPAEEKSFRHSSRKKNPLSGTQAPSASLDDGFAENEDTMCLFLRTRKAWQRERVHYMFDELGQRGEFSELGVKSATGMPGWLSWRGVWLLILGLWVWAPWWVQR